jgi:hypothetical protein
MLAFVLGLDFQSKTPLLQKGLSVGERFERLFHKLFRNLLSRSALLSSLTGIVTVILQFGVLKAVSRFKGDSVRYSPVLIALLVLAVGRAAFLFKRKAQRLYGICEVVFGVLSAYQIAAGLKLQEAFFARWAALVGAIYVVSRGFSNYSDGKRAIQKSTTTSGTLCRGSRLTLPTTGGRVGMEARG